MTQLFRFLFFSFCLLAANAHATDDGPLYDAVGGQDKAAVAALLTKGADVNARGRSGDTPLHNAVGGNTEIVLLLLSKGADVNAKGEFGGTPLHRALNFGRKDIVELLLARGADVNANSEHGTALHRVASGDRSDIVELLLAKGADVNIEEPRGYTPLQYALVHGNKKIVALLLSKTYGNDMTAPIHAANALWASADADKRKEAMRLYRAAYAMWPDDPWVIGVVGWVLHRNDENKEALPLLERAAKLDPSETTRYALAAALFADKQHAKAADQARWLLEQDPLDSGYLMLLGTTAHKTDRYREQVDVQRRLLRLFPQRANLVLYSQLGVGEAVLGDCVAASETLRAGLRAFPDASVLHDWLVVTSYCEGGRTAAESVWRQRKALYTYSERADFYKLVFYGSHDLAEKAQRTGARYVALMHFARAYVVALEAASRTRVDAQWLSEERTQLRSRMFELYRALPLKPAIPAEAHALMQQGERALASGDWRIARAQYAAAVEIAPWSPEARYNLGLAFGAALLNDLPQAIREMEFVQKLSEPAGPLALGATDRLGVWRERQRKALKACGGRVEQSGVFNADVPQLILSTEGACR